MSVSCVRGEILRSGYITKNGIKVPSKCITAQSNSGEKTKDKISKYLKEKEQIYEQARKKFSKESSKKCSKGYIKREGYKVTSHKRKSNSKNSKNSKNMTVKGHWVKPECIKSQTGKSEKGKKLIIIIEKDILGKYGYKDIKSLSKSDRHKSLSKAIKDNKPLSIYRRIKALSTLNKNKDHELYKILEDDALWIKTQQEYISKKSSK